MSFIDKFKAKLRRNSSQTGSPQDNSKLAAAMTPTKLPGNDANPPPYEAIVTSPEDPYAFLSSFNTIFVIDDSGSMIGPSWQEVQEVLRAITRICTDHDPDGIDLYFLNHKTSNKGNSEKGKAPGGFYDIKSADTVELIFNSVRPSGGTPTGQRLQTILNPYLQLLLRSNRHNLDSVSPINIIVITDGVPSDEVEAPIIFAAKKLDELEAPSHQIGIQFFQVGNEPGAHKALQELDDHLSKNVVGGIRDMVDTVTWDKNRGVLTVESILKVVLGAVVRRLDRMKLS